jgi:hypothetical protein
MRPGPAEHGDGQEGIGAAANKGALAATRRNAVIQTFSQRLLEAGKSTKLTLIAHALRVDPQKIIFSLMRRTTTLVILLSAACRVTRTDDRLRSIASAPIATTGAIARRLLTAPGFSWHSFESRHVRVHLSGAMALSRAPELADSAEAARQAVLALLSEPDLSNEPRLELILLETRAEMQRLVGRPVSGSGFPGELTVVMVAGAGYHAFWRHELTHTYAARRWGERRSGSWLDEGLAARATGPCQGHSIDAVAAGYAAIGDAPTLEELTGDFYTLPELPAYFTAASFVDFIQRREGVAALRSLWRGERSDVDGRHPLGGETQGIHIEWRWALSAVQPTVLDTARLRRAGC